MTFSNGTAKSRRFLLRLAIACVLWLSVGGRAHADDIAAGHVLVRIVAGVNIQTLAAAYKTTAQDQVPGTTLYSLATPRGVTEVQFALTLSKDKRVLYAEPDRFIISPEMSGAPFHLAFDRTQTSATYANSTNYTQVHLGQVDVLSQVNGSLPLATGAGVIVAVLDTGATFTHPDLVGHYISGYNALTPGALPLDVADGAANYEFGHGTMVAGVIARLAPQASILPIRVLNGDGVGTLLTLVKGIRYATTHGARVLNMSFGCSVASGAVNDALDEAEALGIVLVAAAGNNNVNQALPPAVGRGTLAVGAVEANNSKSPYSNFGSFVRVVAPGSNIRSTFADGGYATWSGTSFATPFVSAEAALMLSIQPTLTSAQVKDTIRATARSVDAVNPVYKGQLGKGIIDVEAAVRLVRP
jgi:subtilisin family serine protease